MTDNAKIKSCDIITYPRDEKYEERIRQFQGCPTVAVTKKGRIFLGWYSGGYCEPHMDNYNLLTISDDGGRTFSKPVLVIPSSKEYGIHALDIQLWMNPEGELCVFWVQDNAYECDSTEDKVTLYDDLFPRVEFAGYAFDDRRHSMWRIKCKDPDADVLEFDEPKCLDIGFLRCKPTALSDGSFIYCNYDQLSNCYTISKTRDNETFRRIVGAKKLITSYDETMAYQMKDGRVRLMARANDIGRIAECYSDDLGETWSEAKPSNIAMTSTRFFVSRTPSGKVLLVCNDCENERKNMSVYLSEDDGTTWKYKRLIDARTSTSYPDADFHDGKIYVTYDRERMGAKEILFLSFTEEDIMNDSFTFEPMVISKP